MSWAMRARVRNARSDAPAEQLRGMVSIDRILADPDGTRTGPPRSHMAATHNLSGVPA